MRDQFSIIVCTELAETTNLQFADWRPASCICWPRCLFLPYPGHTWITFCKLFYLFTFVSVCGGGWWCGSPGKAPGWTGLPILSPIPGTHVKVVGEPLAQSCLLTRTRASSALWVPTQCSLKVQLHTFAIYFDIMISFRIPPSCLPPFLSLSFSNYSNTVYLKALSGWLPSEAFYLSCHFCDYLMHLGRVCVLSWERFTARICPLLSLLTFWVSVRVEWTAHLWGRASFQLS